jgi:hypothetical protein
MDEGSIIGIIAEPTGLCDLDATLCQREESPRLSLREAICVYLSPSHFIVLTVSSHAHDTKSSDHTRR